jgi:hypothetical protein
LHQILSLKSKKERCECGCFSVKKYLFVCITEPMVLSWQYSNGDHKIKRFEEICAV